MKTKGDRGLIKSPEMVKKKNPTHHGDEAILSILSISSLRIYVYNLINIVRCGAWFQRTAL